MRILTTALAIISGVIVLLGYFIPLPVLNGVDIRLVIINWAIIIAGMAILVGIFNLIAVQVEKVRTRQKGASYGAILIFSMIITFGLGIMFGLDHPLVQATVEAVIVPVEASLMAILAVTLVYASIRLFRRRADVMTIIFLVTGVLFLVAIVLMPLGFGSISQIVLGATGMISRGGARGLLIGIALGTLLTGLRVLFGIDRPYGDK